MKNIWKYGRTGGEYAGKVLDDMLVSVPYTDQPPLEGVRSDGEPLTIADQMFDPKLNQWIILANALDHNDLNNLKAMYEALEHENGNLKQLNAKLMLSFDQTTEIFLQKGTSLLEESSYPTGGKNTHAVLSGHRGLPEAKLYDRFVRLAHQSRYQTKSIHLSSF
ncbi:hypothetical protein EfmAA610_18920 [Enterococcus faecium]|nr:hypothetical protein EfmAA610_18920 [Enterococcus faecium]